MLRSFSYVEHSALRERRARRGRMREARAAGAALGGARCARPSSRPTMRRRAARRCTDALHAGQRPARLVRTGKGAVRAALRARQPSRLGGHSVAGHPRMERMMITAARRETPEALCKVIDLLETDARVPASGRRAPAARWPWRSRIVLVGWLIAKAVRFAVEQALRAVNFNVLTERAGTDHFLQQGGLRGDTTTLFGLFAYWLVILAALIIAFNEPRAHLRHRSAAAGRAVRAQGAGGDAGHGVRLLLRPLRRRAPSTTYCVEAQHSRRGPARQDRAIPHHGVRRHDRA